jgi:hypothetical protein
MTMIQETDFAKIAEVDAIEMEHVEGEVMMRSLTALAVTQDMPIAATCKTNYTATKHSGTRPLSAINLIVMHSTEGSTARGAASWFANPASQGSAHLCVDDKECYRTLSDMHIPWGAKGANFNGFHIEQAGYAKWSSYLWSTVHRKTLNRAAFKAALHCRRYGISARFLTAANLKAGMRNGITTHNECSKAFGGTHYDPGTGWPRKLFMSLVRGYLAVVRVRRLA